MTDKDLTLQGHQDQQGIAGAFNHQGNMVQPGFQQAIHLGADRRDLERAEDREYRRMEVESKLRMQEQRAMLEIQNPKAPEHVRFFGTDEQVSQLLTKLAEASGEFEDLTKAAKGQEGHKNYRYTNMNALVGATRAALSKHKIVVLQPLVRERGSELVRTIVAGWGARIEMDLEVAPGVRGDKGFGLVTTYLRRYQYQATFQLDGEDDPDLDKVQEQDAQEGRNYQRDFRDQRQGNYQGGGQLERPQQTQRQREPQGPQQRREPATASQDRGQNQGPQGQTQASPRSGERQGGNTQAASRAQQDQGDAKTPQTAQGSQTKEERLETARGAMAEVGNLNGIMNEAEKARQAEVAKAKADAEAKAAEEVRRAREHAERQVLGAGAASTLPPAAGEPQIFVPDDLAQLGGKLRELAVAMGIKTPHVAQIKLDVLTAEERKAPNDHPQVAKIYRHLYRVNEQGAEKVAEYIAGLQSKISGVAK